MSSENRFGAGISNPEDPQESRVSKNLVTKKEPMVTRSIRISERDIMILEDYFKSQERTFTQGVRLLLKDFIKSEGLK